MDRTIYKINDLSLDNDELILNETIFHNANGYIGVRSNFEEGYKDGYDSIRGSYINGFYDFAEMKQAEKLCGLCEEKQTMLNVADPQGIKLKIEGENFSLFEGEVLESSRWLDPDEGYTARKVVWNSPSGKKVEILIKRMTSFAQLQLFTIEYSVKALNFSGSLEFVSTHIGDVKNYCNPNDPRVAGESFQHLIPVSAEVEDGVSYIVTNTSKSGLTVCTAVKNVLSKDGEMTSEVSGHQTTTVIKTDIAENETVTLVKYTIYPDSIRHEDCRADAAAAMERALATPLGEHYASQKAYLKRFWDQSALDIQGDDDLAIATKYNIYQLLQSVGKDQYSNIAAKGLSGEGYEGH